MPHYLTVVNTALDPARIAKGNDRVMRARLADAKFFYEEDRRAKIEDRVDKLQGIVFHNRLGTVREKVDAHGGARGQDRVARSGFRTTSVALVRRAAHICKFDLVSLMVGEFPELQGEMGRDYALYAKRAGRGRERRPRSLPRRSAPKAPSPRRRLHLRRARRSPRHARRLLRRRPLSHGRRRSVRAPPRVHRHAAYAPRELEAEPRLRVAGAGRPLRLGVRGRWRARSSTSPKEDTVKKLREFTHERLRGVIATQTSNAAADAACAGGDSDRPAHVLARAKALHSALTEGRAWLEKARTVAKRLSGISKEATPVLHGKDVFEKPDDHAIVDVIVKVDASTKALETEDAVTAALAGAEDLAARLDDVFNRTLVNDPNDARTPKRLELLSHGAKCMLRIGDFSRLV